MGIVRVEGSAGVHTGSAHPLHGGPIDDAAGSIGRTIRTIGSTRQHRQLADAVDRERRGERPLLASPALARAAHGHGRFTSRKNACGRLHRISSAVHLAGNGSEKPADVLRLAFDSCTQNQSVQVQFAGFPCGGLAEELIVGDDVIVDSLEYRISWLGSVGNVPARAFLEAFEHGLRNLETILLNNGNGI